MNSQAEVCRRPIRHSKEQRRAKIPMAIWGHDQGNMLFKAFFPSLNLLWKILDKIRYLPYHSLKPKHMLKKKKDNGSVG